MEQKKEIAFEIDDFQDGWFEISWPVTGFDVPKVTLSFWRPSDSLKLQILEAARTENKDRICALWDKHGSGQKRPMTAKQTIN